MVHKGQLAMSETQSTQEAKAKPDPQAIMKTIRERIKKDVSLHRDTRPAFRAADASSSGKGEHQAGELLNSEELSYINSHYSYMPHLDLDAVSSHRSGLFAKILVKFKRKVLSVVWDYLLKDYFEAERQYQARIVRFLNNASKYIDARDAGNFWELISKIDVDTTRALERIERINDEQMASMRSSERRVFDALDESLNDLRSQVAALSTRAVKHEDQLRTVESVAGGLEAIIGRLKERALPSAIKAQDDNLNENSNAAVDYTYLLLENRYRGSEDEIAERLSIYPPVFAGANKTILDIGPGRGELLKLFKQAGLSAYGVDIDQAMVEAAGAAGFDVRHENGLEHLAALSDNELGGVIAIQVVEHLSREQLEALFELCFRKVAPGGKVVFETINPRSLLALSSNYFRDLTHVWPLHPDTLAHAMNVAGLKVLETRFLSEVSEEAQLKAIKVEDYMTPRWAYTVETLNRNFRQLNELIYGYQDYCIIAEVRE